MSRSRSWDASGKTCSGCKTHKPLTEFRVRPERSGYRSKCVSCEQVLHNDWRSRNIGASRARNLKSKYGITPKQYFEMLDAQGGVCDICGSPESGWSTSPFLHVDHDHVTGENRGLLCHQCNIGVGLVENGMPIDALQDYLEKHRQTDCSGARVESMSTHERFELNQAVKPTV